MIFRDVKAFVGACVCFYLNFQPALLSISSDAEFMYVSRRGSSGELPVNFWPIYYDRHQLFGSFDN